MSLVHSILFSMPLYPSREGLVVVVVFLTPGAHEASQSLYIGPRWLELTGVGSGTKMGVWR